MRPDVLHRSAALIGALSVIALLGAGCDPLGMAKQQAEKAKAEAEARMAGSLADQAMKQVTGGRVGMDTKGGQVTFIDKESGKSYSMGENVTIPPDFPSEMLVYPKARVLSLTTGAEASLNLKVEASADTVALWYADKLKALGWKEASKVAAGGYESRTYTKDSIKLSLTFLGSREDGSTTTVISMTRKKSP